MSTLVSSISSYLPQHPGFLPSWLLLVGTVAILNSVQSYLTLSYTKRVYSSSSPKYPPKPTPSHPDILVPLNSPATPLSARTFGVWTFMQGLVRVYAAYNIDNPAFYQLAFGTFLIAGWHFWSEWLLFGSCSWGKPLAGPIFVSMGSSLWMISQWGFYAGR